MKCPTEMEEYDLWIERQKSKRKTSAQSGCVGAVEEYIWWKERQCRIDGRRAEEVAWGKKMEDLKELTSPSSRIPRGPPQERVSKGD